MSTQLAVSVSQRRSREAVTGKNRQYAAMTTLMYIKRSLGAEFEGVVHSASSGEGGAFSREGVSGMVGMAGVAAS